MVNSLNGPPDVVEAIGTAALRICRFFEAIEQGHSFGIGPGEHDKPWTLGFHQAAMSIYAETLSWEYMLGLADAYEDCAALMLSLEAPATHAPAWAMMLEYLQAVRDAIRDSPNRPDGDHTKKMAGDIEPTAPPVVPFGKLSTLASAKGTTTLIAASQSIETLCGLSDTCPITEQEKEWLRRLRDGDRTIDLARDQGYSERSLYRALSDMWDRMNVDNRAEAIGLAMKNNWID